MGWRGERGGGGGGRRERERREGRREGGRVGRMRSMYMHDDLLTSRQETEYICVNENCFRKDTRCGRTFTNVYLLTGRYG